MKKFRFLDIGKESDYFDEKANKELCERIAGKCYLPANKLMLKLINESQGDFKISYSITGTALEQFKAYAPEVIDSFKELASTGCVEFLAETYYHSLASVFSEKEFDFQVKKHAEAIESLFGMRPKIFRNTELVYNNSIAAYAENMGFTGVLSEGSDKVLGWRSPNFLYKPAGTKQIGLIMKNFKFSDDIAFRFSDKKWSQWPMTSEKFVDAISSEDGNSVNLFMDYETLGEHHSEETGIFDFFQALPSQFKSKGVSFVTPSEIIEQFEPVMELDVNETISWADAERDMSAWTGNKMQDNATSEIYKLEKAVKESGDSALIETWRKLTTSDHFYYMSTKKMNDGMVHNYFSPYNTPYDSFISYMNIISDMTQRLSLGDSLSSDNSSLSNANNINEEIIISDGSDDSANLKATGTSTVSPLQSSRVFEDGDEL